MSRADELREAIGKAHELASFHMASTDGAGMGIARALVDIEGVSWEMVDAINDFVDTTDADRDELMWAAHDFLSDLLTAAGISRGGAAP